MFGRTVGRTKCRVCVRGGIGQRRPNPSSRINFVLRWPTKMNDHEHDTKRNYENKMNENAVGRDCIYLKTIRFMSIKTHKFIILGEMDHSRSLSSSSSSSLTNRWLCFRNYRKIIRRPINGWAFRFSIWMCCAQRCTKQTECRQRHRCHAVINYFTSLPQFGFPF